MTGRPLERAIAESTTEELERAALILHVAGQSQRRLLAAWTTRAAVIEPAFPALLAAVCLELHLELVGRGARRELCPACNHLLVQFEAGPVDGSPASAAPVASGSAERAPLEALA